MRDKGAKRTANRKLHIDDGCMGGGEAIPYDDETTRVEFRGTRYGDITEPNTIITDYFTHSRYGIFHYCCFGDVDDGDNDGYGTMPGYYFWISDSNMNPKVDDQGQTFMHELGHNLNLDHPQDDPDVPDDAKTAMRNDGTTYIKYHSEEWKKVDPSIGLP